MTLVSLVYAQSKNGVIGADGGLPWHIPSDLKRFKETTLGKPVGTIDGDFGTNTVVEFQRSANLPATG